MTFNTEFIFMTAETELRIGAGRNRMGNMKFRTVDIHHVVAWFTHLIGKTGLVAIQAV